MRGFPGVWKLPLLRLPSQDRSLSLTLLSLFHLLYFVLPPFKENGLLFWCLMSSASDQKLFVVFAQRSNDLLMNSWGRKWSPRPILLPS